MYASSVCINKSTPLPATRSLYRVHRVLYSSSHFCFSTRSQNPRTDHRIMNWSDEFGRSCWFLQPRRQYYIAHTHHPCYHVVSGLECPPEGCRLQYLRGSVHCTPLIPHSFCLLLDGHYHSHARAWPFTNTAWYCTHHREAGNTNGLKPVLCDHSFCACSVCVWGCCACVRICPHSYFSKSRLWAPLRVSCNHHHRYRSTATNQRQPHYLITGCWTNGLIISAAQLSPRWSNGAERWRGGSVWASAGAAAPGIGRHQSGADGALPQQEGVGERPPYHNFLPPPPCHLYPGPVAPSLVAGHCTDSSAYVC